MFSEDAFVNEREVVPLIIFFSAMTIDCVKFADPKLVKHTLKFELRSKLLFFK